jgi:very-short-patch-repair endonuclease
MCKHKLFFCIFTCMEMETENKRKKVKDSAKYGEILLEYNVKSPCLFEDPIYGKFTCSYYNFIKGKSCHPKRRDYSHNKKYKTIKEGDDILKNNELHYLKILEWDGLMTSVATFLDVDYGEFNGVFRDVVRKSKQHPKRTKNKRKESSKSLWKDDEYRKKTIKSIKDSINDEVKESRKKTMLKKYGVDSPLKSAEIQEKKNNTNLKKYGVKHYAQTVEFKENFSKINPFIHKKEEVYNSKLNKGSIHIYSGKTMLYYAIETGKAYTTFQSQVKKYGIDNALLISKKDSGIEIKLENLFIKNNIKYKKQFKINNRIADFLLEDKLIIECDGLFWHSDCFQNNNFYHKEKKELYKNHGYSSLFFREDEINNKEEIVLSIIKNKLNKNINKKFARNLLFKKINKKESNKFFENYHLMGRGFGDSYALVDSENKIYCAIRVNRLKDGSIKINRFCSIPLTSIVGGYSKILKNIIKLEKPKSIINFIDLRYGSGEYLKQFGFDCETESLSFKWTNFKQTYHRMNFKGNSGYDRGLFKIWDCGQKKYVLYLKDNY